MQIHEGGPGLEQFSTQKWFWPGTVVYINMVLAWNSSLHKSGIIIARFMFGSGLKQLLLNWPRYAST